MNYQRPAYEQVTIAHGGNTVTLRPSLRAAATLVERFGFPDLERGLDEGSLTVISEIILHGCENQRDAAAFLSLRGKPLSTFFMIVREPLFELVAMFIPKPDPNAKLSSGTGKPVPWAEAYGTLYDKATGWLGWTPETAWNATPTEISRAMSAHFDRLVTTGVLVRDDKRSVANSADPEQAQRNIAAGLDPDFDHAGLRALKAKIAGHA